MWLVTFLGLASILGSSLIFINAVEQLGEKLGLTRFAVGAVLIAFLTALPETSIALISPLVGSTQAFEVGQAAVVGAPSITILLGVPLIFYITKRRAATQKGISLNYEAFAILFPIAVALGYFASQLRMIGAVVVLAFGCYFAYLNVKMEGERFETKERLYLSRLIQNELVALPLQLVVGLIGLLYSADVFIDSLAALANPFFYAVILSPFGTCLQEVLAATILAAKGRGDIGLAVLAGENMIQSTFVAGIGMLATPWQLTLPALLLAVTFAAVAASYSLAPRTMRFLGIPAYVAYVLIALI